VQPSPFLVFSSFSLLFSPSSDFPFAAVVNWLKIAGHGRGRNGRSLGFPGRKKRERDLVHGREKETDSCWPLN